MSSVPASYDRAVQQIASHPQSHRLCQLLFALQYQRWPSQSPQMNESQLQQSLKAIVAHTQTPKALATQLQGIVSRLNKAQVYQKVAAALLDIIAPLYPQPSQVRVTKLELTMATYYDLRLEVTRYCTPLHVKLLLGALLAQKPVPAQRLERFSLIELLQRLVDRFSDIELLRAQVQQTLKGFNNDVAYANAGDRLLKVLQPLYSRSQSTAAVDVRDTPPTFDQEGGDDDAPTGQLFAQPRDGC